MKLIQTKAAAIQYLKTRNKDSEIVKFESIDFSNTIFDFEVDFSKCTLSGNINFKDARFEQKASFIETHFVNFAEFDRTHFMADASFYKCHFSYGARFNFASFQNVTFFSADFAVWIAFWHAKFHKDANFSQCVVHLPSNVAESSDRQANFSWAIFEGNADFRLSKFYTPVFLWRTIFKKNVFFNYCIFDKEVVIGARPIDVHFTKAEKLSISTLGELIKREILIQDMERQFDKTFLFTNIFSTEQLTSELRKVNSLNQNEKSLLLSEWKKGNYNMFQEGKNVSFNGAQFNNLDSSVFNYLNISKTFCDKAIYGSNEQKLKFSSMLNKNSHDYFISYAYEEDDFARNLTKELTKKGQIVWFEEEDIIIGDNLFDTLKNGIENSRFFIMIISKHYFSKKWTNAEFSLIRDNIDKIIQIWVDLTEEDVKQHSPELSEHLAFQVRNYNEDLYKLSLDIIYSTMKHVPG